MTVDGIHELASEWELEQARRSAAERHRFGDGLITNVETLEWSEGNGPNTTLCFARIESRPHTRDLCTRYAGAGTSHPGVGHCWQHGGSTPEGIREGAWIVAHGFATALNVTPWEGLLWAVKIAAGRVAFIEHKLATAEVDRQLEPPDRAAISEAGRTQDFDGTNLWYWVKQAELWHDKLAKVSKLAIDAGVAERLVRQLEVEATIMLRATNLTLDELGLDDDTRQRALGIMSRNLLALEAEEVGDRINDTESN